jgi:uncharacterized protein (TIGR02145 family)
MKFSFRISLLFLVLTLFHSCKKGDDNSVRDIDGNKYSTVVLGSQVWFVENLKTTRYSNGDLIETTTPSNLDIMGEDMPKYQWPYAGDDLNVDPFGRLYTWYAVSDSRNICPAGWHVPSDSEWTALTDYLIANGFGYEGSGSNILKAVSSKTEWVTSTIPGNIGCEPDSNNSSGFNALPGGLRYQNGTFSLLGSGGWWWTATDYSISTAWFRSLGNYSSEVKRDRNHLEVGYSVRCLKN